MRYFLAAILILLTLFAVVQNHQSTTTHPLLDLPFQITLPAHYQLTESPTAYYFSSEREAVTFIFKKTPEEKAFTELFEGGYTIVTGTSNGIWVICGKENAKQCFVQNTASPEFYPLIIEGIENSLDEDESLPHQIQLQIQAD